MYQFTDADRKRGAEQRNKVLPPERRRELSRRAGYRRWYRVDAAATDRIDRHLKIASGIVGYGLSIDDYPLVLRAMTAMVPYERMKIALESGLLNVTPGEFEGQSEIETKLQASAHRRQRKMLEEQQTVEVKAEPPK